MNLIEKIKNIQNRKRIFWIAFGIIIAIGIFFRTYNFHDWLRFNMDQGRDAILIGSVVDGTAPPPLLGSKAGGTEFKLGPMPYYFQIASAKIFGNEPDKMAYPDLITSILCIPLLFFFLRKYFSNMISLAGTAIFAVSSFAIEYSRFAWNPNSSPFWAMLSLYGMHNVISKKNNRKILWSTITGVAIGISVQLHATLLLFLPITTIFIFGFLLIKKATKFRYFFLIVAISLFLNVPQFINEYRTGGENINRFFDGIHNKKSNPDDNLIKNILHDSSCWIESNATILTGYIISDSCAIKKSDRVSELITFILSAFFILTGLLLGLKYFLHEQDENKKSFLAILFLYMGIAYIIYVPLAYTIFIRFFLLLIFFPFILLGFWIKFLEETLDKKAFTSLALILISMLIAANIFFVYKSFSELAGFQKGRGGGKIAFNTTLKELEGIAQFIVDNSAGEKEVFIKGNKQYIKKILKPTKFLVSKSDINLSTDEENNYEQQQVFYLTNFSENKKKKLEEKKDTTKIKYGAYGRFLIYLGYSN